MRKKTLLLLTVLTTSFMALGSDINVFNIPFGQQINAEGLVNIDLLSLDNPEIKKTFYGADTNGFSKLPDSSLVTPLQLGYLKLGGNLYSMFNWQLDAYYDRYEDQINYVYAPLENRIKLIQDEYKSTPLFQVNMLGWQPNHDANGKLIVKMTADEEHAADAINYLNGVKKIGLKNIIMGNEPFLSFEVHGKAIPSADEYIDKYIKYAMALRSAEEKVSGNSNDIKLWGPEISTGWTGWQTTHPDDCVEDEAIPEKIKCSYGEGNFTEFMPYFLYRISKFENDRIANPKKYKMLDYITMHYYPLFRKDFNNIFNIISDPNGNQNVHGMLESVNVWDSEFYVNKYDYASPLNVPPKIISKFNKWKNEYYSNSKLAVTEFAIDSVLDVDYHPIVRPLYLADLIGRLGAAGVDTFINSFLQGGDKGSRWAMINGESKTRLYNIYYLFSNYFLGSVLNTSDTLGDKVNAYAVKKDKEINVFLVNKDSKIHRANLVFKNGRDLSNVTQVALPAWSVTVLNVPEDHRQMIKVLQYGANEMKISISPI